MIHDLSYYRKIQGATDSSSTKETQIRQRKAELDHYFELSQDCEDVKVNGVDQKVAITKSTDPAIKHIVSKPDETIYLGDIVNWSDVDWIVDTIDADTRINSKGKIRRCNIDMVWLDENGVTRTYPGFCEDATKYSDGVAGGKIVQIGEFQIKVKIHLDEHSAKINRDKRFLLDASLYLPQMEVTGAHPSAYVVTRRNVLTGNCDGHGYVELTLCETAYSEMDNPILMIADYYSIDDVYALTISNADENLTVAKNATYTLSCSATKNGVALNQTSILFQSSNTSVATVSTAGVIRGVANGTCVVTVKSGNVSQEVPIEIVTASSTAMLKIYSTDPTIIYGRSKTFEYDVFVDGVPVAAPFVATLLNATAKASITSTGSNFAVIAAVDSELLVGETFTLQVVCNQRSLTATQEIEIKGWF